MSLGELHRFASAQLIVPGFVGGHRILFIPWSSSPGIIFDKHVKKLK